MKHLQRLLLLVIWAWLAPVAAQSIEPLVGIKPFQAATPGVYDTFLLLGQSAVFSGSASSLGREYRRGAVTYFDYINTQGGVHGRRIFLISRDDGYEPERAEENTRLLLTEDRVFTLFGYVGTPTSRAALDLVNEYNVPFIAPFTGAELLRTPVNPNVFNVRASYYQETAMLVQRLLDQGKRKIAVFYQDDSYGQSGLDGVRLAMDRNNLAIIATGTVERNSINVGDAVRTIAATKPDGVILVSAYASCAEFIRQAKASGMEDAEFLNVSFVGSKALVNDLWLDSEGVVVSQVVPFPGDETIPIVAEYTQVSRYFSDLVVPSYGSLEGFIAAKVLVEGLQRAGRELTRDRLVRAMNSMQNFDLGGFQLSWSQDNHGGSNFVDITVIGQQNRWVY